MTARLTDTMVVAVVERLTRHRLESFIAAGCILPAERDGERVFAEADVARLELLCELCEDFGLDEDGLALVMSLLDQLHGLRHEMRRLVRAIDAEPEEVRRRIGAAYLRERD